MAPVDPDDLGEFGRYELVHQLGKGGMARVYRAVRSGPMGFRREVALKVLDPKATESEEQIRALIDEARLGGLLRHRNIVGTDEFEKVGETYYIAMEFVDGWSLDRILKLHRKTKEVVPFRAALQLLVEICHGLHYAHSRTDESGEPLGIVHRDLKPGNVMVSRRGEVKIMDFGIAKAATNLYRTQEGHTRGTPLYMSPEQVMGGDIDQRSDLFSLGSILHVLITLKPCFKGDSFVSIMRAVLDVETTPAETRIKKAAPSILPLFKRLMESEPEDRYASAAELELDLVQLLSEHTEGEDLVEWIERIESFLPVSGGPIGAVAPKVPAAISDRTDVWSAGEADSPETQAGDLRELSPLAGLGDDPEPFNLGSELSELDVLSDDDQTQPSMKTPAPGAAPNLALREDSLAPLAIKSQEVQGEIGFGASRPEGAAVQEHATPLPNSDLQLPANPWESGGSVGRSPAAAGSPRWDSRTAGGNSFGSSTADSASKRSQEAGWQRRARRTARWEVVAKLSVVAIVLSVGLPFFPGPIGDAASRARDLSFAHAVLALESRGVDVGAVSHPVVDELRQSRDRTRARHAPGQAIESGLIALEGGYLILGKSGEADAEPSPRALEIPPFRIMATEVTVKEFEGWCGGSVLGGRCKAWLGTESWQGKHHPVVNVNWDLARQYCIDWGGRLPTEAEWEFAARGEEGRAYPWGETWSEGRVNYCDLGCKHALMPITYINDGIPNTAPVGSLPKGASPEGVLDLSGNVAEWTLDCWVPSHRDRQSWLPSSEACSKRVIRGGAWRDPQTSQNSWRRAAAQGGNRSARVGFRCLKGLDPEAP